MSFIFTFAGMIIGASIVVTLLVRVGWLVARRRPKRFWRRALVAHAVLVPIYVFVVTPALLGWLATTRIGTRGDERGYDGPRIAADGTWVMQSRASLRDEKTGITKPDPALAESARARTVRFKTSDGVTLRGFLVPPKTTPPRCTVILVHGLFRGALELEAPASMFRDLGAETFLVEMRNHGQSERAGATFGWNERLDVLGAVAWIRSDPDRAQRPLILYAVSLGTAAVMRAAPDVPSLAGLVLDAPMDDLLATAHRMLSEADPRPGRRGLGVWQPFRSLMITALELWTGCRFADVRPIDDIARLSPDLPALIIGGGEDRRMPPEGVKAIFDRLPSRPEKKILWIREGSGHGQVWIDDPAGYKETLAEFLRLAAP